MTFVELTIAGSRHSTLLVRASKVVAVWQYWTITDNEHSMVRLDDGRKYEVLETCDVVWERLASAGAQRVATDG